MYGRVFLKIYTSLFSPMNQIFLHLTNLALEQMILRSTSYRYDDHGKKARVVFFRYMQS